MERENPANPYGASSLPDDHESCTDAQGATDGPEGEVADPLVSIRQGDYREGYNPEPTWSNPCGWVVGGCMVWGAAWCVAKAIQFLAGGE